MTLGQLLAAVRDRAPFEGARLRVPADADAAAVAAIVFDSRQASQHFLACRLADDYCYQTHVRPRAGEKAAALGADLFALGAACDQVEAYVRAELAPLAAQTYARVTGSAREQPPWEFRISLPWHRLFEVEVEVAVAA